MIIIENIWLILFVTWGLPLTFYRDKFRKIVYQTDSWTINIKPYFTKELKALFGNMYPNDRNYLNFRNFYLLYLKKSNSALTIDLVTLVLISL